MTMIIHQVRRGVRCLVMIAVVSLVGGCASAATVADPPGPSSSAPTPTPEPAPAPAPAQPLLVISGSVADPSGQSLTITLTTTSVRTPTDQDRADFAATRCGESDPTYAFPTATDTRVVTMSVRSVASPGFAGWQDARGVRVAGSLFAGSIWDAESHGTGATCYADSRITRPGEGEVRIITSSDGWNLDNPVVGDASITLGSYGFDAVTRDALGLPTGLTAVVDCTTTPSPAFDALALDLLAGRWGRSDFLPEYCFYGRSPGD